MAAVSFFLIINMVKAFEILLQFIKVPENVCKGMTSVIWSRGAVKGLF